MSGTEQMQSAIQRVENYVNQRSGRASLDPDEIHAVDVGCETEAILTLSDLRGLLALARTSQPVLIDAMRVLGWQGGTIHQVIDVLRLARGVVDAHHAAGIDGEWDVFRARVASLRSAIHGSGR